MKIINARQTIRVATVLILIALVYVAVSSNPTEASSKTSANVPTGNPNATIDLGSVEGVKAVKGEWRYSDT